MNGFKFIIVHRDCWNKQKHHIPLHAIVDLYEQLQSEPDWPRGMKPQNWVPKVYSMIALSNNDEICVVETIDEIKKLMNEALKGE